MSHGPDIEPHLRGTGREPHRYGSGREPHRPGGGREPHLPGGGHEPHRPGGGNEPHAHGSGTGADDALVSSALNTTSMALMDAAYTADEPKGWRPRSVLWRREPWVRAVIAQQALLRRLAVAGDTLWLRAQKAGETDQALLTLARPDAATLHAQLGHVLLLKDDRPDRLPEVLVQREDLWSFWSAVTGVHAATAPRSFELLEVATQLSVTIGQPLKHALNVDRPFERSARVQPMIATPGHASYPSGHATAAWLFATVMTALLGVQADHTVARQLAALAARIAQNREVAGLHYPMDSAAGKALGELLGTYFVACCVGGKVPTGCVHDPSAMTTACAKGARKAAVRKVAELAELWNAARSELGLP